MIPEPNTSEERNRRKQTERTPFSEVLSNPKKGLFTSLYDFFRGSYNPSLTERNVTPSPDIPVVDASLLLQVCSKHSWVWAVACL